MRALTVILAAGLLLAPLSVAQDGDPPRSADDCRQADDPQQCKERYCRANPEECRDAERSPDKQRTPPERQCDDDCAVDLKHISFEIDREARVLRDYALGDRILFETMALRVDGPLEVQRKSNQIIISGDEWSLRLQDNPTANIGFKSETGELVLTLPDGTQTSQGDEGVKIIYGDVRAALVSESYDVDGHTIIVEEFAAFHVPSNYGRHDDDDDGDDDDDAREKRDEKVRDAIEKRRLGAEVRIRQDAVDGDDVTVTEYDDVDVQVKAPRQATRDDPLLITVSADLTEGRTFVFDIDPAMLRGPELEARYFDVQDDGNRTEVVFRMASDLQDVLDATDDGGQPEYWIVRDANGIQMLASVPYWSTHEISLASLGEFLVQPSVLIGIGAGIGGVGVAALILLRPRRLTM